MSAIRNKINSLIAKAEKKRPFSPVEFELVPAPKTGELANKDIDSLFVAPREYREVKR